MNYNKECPCCHWKFYVAETYKSHAVCVKCGRSGNNVDNVQNIIHDFSTTTTAVNFTADEFQDISISANTTFTGSNYAIGKSKTILLLHL